MGDQFQQTNIPDPSSSATTTVVQDPNSSLENNTLPSAQPPKPGRTNLPGGSTTAAPDSMVNREIQTQPLTTSNPTDSPDRNNSDNSTPAASQTQPVSASNNSLIDDILRDPAAGGRRFTFGTDLGYEALNNLYIQVQAGDDGAQLSTRYVTSPNIRIDQNSQFSTRNFYGAQFGSSGDIRLDAGQTNRTVTFDPNWRPERINTTTYGASAGLNGAGVSFSNSNVTVNPVGTLTSSTDMSVGVNLPFGVSAYIGSYQYETNPDGTPVTAPALTPFSGGTRQLRDGGFLSYNGFLGFGGGLEVSNVRDDGSYNSVVLEVNNPRAPLGAFLPNFTAAFQAAGAPEDALVNFSGRSFLVSGGGNVSIGASLIGPIPLPIFSVGLPKGTLEGPPVERIIENNLAANISISGNAVRERFNPLHYQQFQEAFDLGSIVLPAASQNAIALPPSRRGSFDSVQFATQNEQEVIELFKALNPGLQLNEQQTRLLPEMLRSLSADVAINTRRDAQGNVVSQQAIVPFTLDNAQEYVLRSFVARQYLNAAQNNPQLLQEIASTFGPNAKYPDASLLALPENIRQYFPAVAPVTLEQLEQQFERDNRGVTITDENRPLFVQALGLRAGNIPLNEQGMPVVARETDLDAWVRKNGSELATGRQPNFQGYETPRQEVNMEIVRDAQGRRIGLAGFSVSLDPYRTAMDNLDRFPRRADLIEDSVVLQHNERIDLDGFAVLQTLQRELGSSVPASQYQQLISQMTPDEYARRASMVSDQELQGMIRPMLDRTADRLTQEVFENLQRGGVVTPTGSQSDQVGSNNITRDRVQALIESPNFKERFPNLNLSITTGRNVDTHGLWNRQAELVQSEVNALSQLPAAEAQVIFNAVPLEQRGRAGQLMGQLNQLQNPGYVLQRIATDNGRDELRNQLRSASELAQRLELSDLATQLRTQADRVRQVNAPDFSAQVLQEASSVPEAQRTPQQQTAAQLVGLARELSQGAANSRQQWLTTLAPSQPLVPSTQTNLAPTGDQPATQPSLQVIPSQAGALRERLIVNTAASLINLPNPTDAAAVEQSLRAQQPSAQEIVLIFDEIGGIGRGIQIREQRNRIAQLQQTISTLPSFRQAVTSSGATESQLRRVEPLPAASATNTTPAPVLTQTPQNPSVQTQSLTTRENVVRDFARSIEGVVDSAAIQAQIQQRGLNAAEIIATHDLIGNLARTQGINAQQLERMRVAQESLRNTEAFRSAVTSLRIDQSRLLIIEARPNPSVSATPAPNTTANNLNPQPEAAAIRQIALGLVGLVPAGTGNATFNAAAITEAERLVNGSSRERLLSVYNSLGNAVSQANASRNTEQARAFAMAQTLLGQTPTFRSSGLQIQQPTALATASNLQRQSESNQASARVNQNALQIAQAAATLSSEQELSAFIGQRRPTPGDLATAYNILAELANNPQNASIVNQLKSGQQRLSQTAAFRAANIPSNALTAIP